MTYLIKLLHSFVFLFTGLVVFSQTASPDKVAPADPVAAPTVLASPLQSWKWKPDYYRAVVIYKDENSVESDEGIKAIQSKIDDKIKSLNLLVRKTNISDKANIDEKTAEMLKLLEPGFPFTMIYFPENSEVENPLWTGHMTFDEALIISDSPVRREIARRLLKGESVVWLLIESGVEYKDYRILKLITEEIKNDGTGSSADDTPLPPVTDGKKEEIKSKTSVKMSIIRISREDADEKFLLNMLNAVEPEIMNVSNEPVLVPIYARGRILNLFTDDKINRENIRNAIDLFAGKGIDREKLPNRGAALLLSVNWDAFAARKLSIDEELPALKTFSDNFSLEDVFPNENPPSSDLASASVAADGGQTVAVKTPFSMRIINIILVSIIGSLVLLFFAVVLRAKR